MILDNAIWGALQTGDRVLAQGGDLALRYRTDVSPFMAIAEPSAEALNALRELVEATGPGAFTSVDAVDFRGLKAQSRGTVYQMIATTPVPSASSPHAIVPLTDADVPAMMALTTLTNPGPFRAHTHQLGGYIGIKVDGELVAMAGERMHPAGYAEISAVCVHPAFQGRGFARPLFAAVAKGIEGRGLTPFLHVFTDNAAAIAMYTRYGFEIRASFLLTTLQSAES